MDDSQHDVGHTDETEAREVQAVAGGKAEQGETGGEAGDADASASAAVVGDGDNDKDDGDDDDDWSEWD